MSPSPPRKKRKCFICFIRLTKSIGTNPIFQTRAALPVQIPLIQSIVCTNVGDGCQAQRRLSARTQDSKTDNGMKIFTSDALIPDDESLGGRVPQIFAIESLQPNIRPIYNRCLISKKDARVHMLPFVQK